MGFVFSRCTFLTLFFCFTIGKWLNITVSGGANLSEVDWWLRQSVMGYRTFHLEIPGLNGAVFSSVQKSLSSDCCSQYVKWVGCQRPVCKRQVFTSQNHHHGHHNWQPQQRSQWFPPRQGSATLREDYGQVCTAAAVQILMIQSSTSLNRAVTAVQSLRLSIWHFPNIKFRRRRGKKQPFHECC